MLVLTILVLVLTGAEALAAPGNESFSLRAGDDAGLIWLEFPDAGEGFDLDGDPGRPTGCRLTIQGLTGTPEEVAAALAAVSSIGVEAGTERGTMIVSLPFPQTALDSVKRLPGGWRLTFSPSRPGSVADGGNEYRLGTRDSVAISVFGHDDLTREETVPPGGSISFPLIGEVQAAGKTVGELKEAIERRLAADFLVNPQVNVSVKSYESQWVNVVGQVRNAGKQPIRGRSTLIDVLTAAGGLTDAAGNEIVVSRAAAGGGQVRVNRDDLFSVHNEAFNLVLNHGDVVNVLEQAVFYIQGEVVKPGSYPLERGYTLMKAISVAGGFSQWADRKEVELLRADEGDEKKIVINLKAISERKRQDVNLRAEDIIIVRRRVL